jgi:hypothetical protein
MKAAVGSPGPRPPAAILGDVRGSGPAREHEPVLRPRLPEAPKHAAELIPPPVYLLSRVRSGDSGPPAADSAPIAGQRRGSLDDALSPETTSQLLGIWDVV